MVPFSGQVMLTADEDQSETVASELEASSLSQVDMPPSLRKALRPT